MHRLISDIAMTAIILIVASEALSNDNTIVDLEFRETSLVFNLVDETGEVIQYRPREKESENDFGCGPAIYEVKLSFNLDGSTNVLAYGKWLEFASLTFHNDRRVMDIHGNVHANMLHGEYNYSKSAEYAEIAIGNVTFFQEKDGLKVTKILHTPVKEVDSVEAQVSDKKLNRYRSVKIDENRYVLFEVRHEPSTDDPNWLEPFLDLIEYFPNSKARKLIASIPNSNSMPTHKYVVNDNLFMGGTYHDGSFTPVAVNLITNEVKVLDGRQYGQGNIVPIDEDNLFTAPQIIQ